MKKFLELLSGRGIRHAKCLSAQSRVCLVYRKCNVQSFLCWIHLFTMCGFIS